MGPPGELKLTPLWQLRWVRILVGALVVYFVAALSFILWDESQLARAKEASANAIRAYKAEEWRECIDSFEVALEFGRHSTKRAASAHAILSDAYLRVHDYRSAHQSAWRCARIHRELLDSDASIQHLLLARTLSFRYASTGQTRFRKEGLEQVRLYYKKCMEDGKATPADIVPIQGATHRLETGELITDSEYIDRIYPE